MGIYSLPTKDVCGWDLFEMFVDGIYSRSPLISTKNKSNWPFDFYIIYQIKHSFFLTNVGVLEWLMQQTCNQLSSLCAGLNSVVDIVFWIFWNTVILIIFPLFRRIRPRIRKNHHLLSVTSFWNVLIKSACFTHKNIRRKLVGIGSSVLNP